MKKIIEILGIIITFIILGFLLGKSNSSSHSRDELFDYYNQHCIDTETLIEKIYKDCSIEEAMELLDSEEYNNYATSKYKLDSLLTTTQQY